MASFFVFVLFTWNLNPSPPGLLIRFDLSELKNRFPLYLHCYFWYAMCEAGMAKRAERFGFDFLVFCIVTKEQLSFQKFVCNKLLYYFFFIVAADRDFKLCNLKFIAVNCINFCKLYYIGLVYF